MSGASSIPVSGDTDRTRSQGGAPVEADQRPSSRAPHRPAPRPAQPSGQHHHWGSSSSSSSRGGYSHHRYSDPWLPHSRDPSNLFRGERGPLASSGLGPSAQSHANWELYRPASASPAYLCHGPQSEHKTCNLEACPGGAVDPRAAQCSGFNSQEFMGRRYEWEPFLEAGGGYQRCELNCRPVGFRFYVRHAERVWDGTPCQGNSSALCITGRCLSPGCDGVLGSNLTLDSCGVCGGDGATCRRVAGTFQNSSVPIGYHQFLKIPPGATRITITERERSPNYLALRTGSGLSVINGRWAVDPPGQYEAGGTLFQYRRGGAGGEMLTAPGPTTTVLLVYIIFHKKNPGIDYEFYLPAERRRAEELEREQRERQGFSALTLVSPPGPLQTPLVAPPLREASPAPLSRGSARNVRIPPRTDLPPQSLPDFLWRRAGLTDCSASCGKGFHFPVFQCVSRKTQQEVEDRKCDPTAKSAPVEEACNVQPCPAFWEAGAWSGCSQSCGPGEQQRQVQCRQVYGAHSTMVHPQLCSSLLRPNSTQPCQLRVCSHWEIRSNWSSCSVMCGQGQRTRSVRCVSTHGATVSEGECSAGLRPRGNEACNMGPCVHSWLSSDWSNTCSVECGTGVQRRSVVCLASRADGPSEQSCGGARPAELRACSGGACQPSTRWYTGPWSECNVECGNGTQRRDIICVNKLGADFNVTPARDCAHLEKLPSVQECSAGPCRAKWYTTQWSACSRSCVGGVQAREVRCLTEDRALSQQCDPDLKPAEKQSCNTQPCTGETDENCRDTHHSCPLVVQARLCVYSYYRTVCCAACERGAERSKRQREREKERDTETQRDRERETQRERDTERERDIPRHRDTLRDTETH